MSSSPSVVIGSLNLDRSVVGARLPVPGETVVGGALISTPGGKGCNQAMAMAALGASVAMVGRVGADAAGRQLEHALEGAGVVTTYLVVDDDAESGTALIFIDVNGENAIMVAPGANERLAKADVDAASEIIEAAPVVVCQLEIPLATAAHGMRLARGTVILNPAPSHPAAGDLLSLADIVVPNRGELAHLAGAQPGRSHAEIADQARRLVGPAVVVVTLGSEGALLVEGHHTCHVEAEPVEVVDTTGAGDAFTGALAVAIAEGRDLEAAVRFANRAAGVAVGRRGAQAGLATRRDLL